MATSPIKDSEKTLKIPKAAQVSLMSFLDKILSVHESSTKELVNKMNAIDVAYARYKASTQPSSDGVDTVSAEIACDVFDTRDRITPPIVVSQVDSYVAYLADVFLSGSPLFPVVSTPATKKYAEQLETLLDDHALLGAYPRHLLMFLRDAVKYNYSALEVEWDAIDQYSSINDFANDSGRKLSNSDKFFTRVRRLNPRNVIRDATVLPGEAAEKGDYAGHIERMSMTRLKRQLIKWNKQGRAFNIEAAMATAMPASSGDISALFEHNPQISDYVSKEGYMSGRRVDWDAYAEGGARKEKPSYGAQYELVTLYARIMPGDHGLSMAPQPNTPQIWKLVLVNGQVLVQAHRVISAYDYLPVLFGQPLEDGFAEQTQSIAEGEIPFQNAVETLINIKFSASRRAVSDRALYDSNHLTSAQVNSKGAAPKLPVNISPLAGVKLSEIYYQIPFDSRGTETAIGDAQMIVGFSKELHGLNSARTGQFQKGNKSVTEWNDTMSGSENRQRLPALTLEYQVFAPLKSMLALNVFQYGESASLISQKTGDVVNIDIAELRKQTLSFRIADGYTPKSKLASTESLAQGITMLGQSQALQAAYGPMLPAMFAHLMSLMGVKGLEEYNPQQAQQAAPTGAPVNNLGQAALQDPNAAPQGAPVALPPATP